MGVSRGGGWGGSCPDGVERFTLGGHWAFLTDVNCDSFHVGGRVESSQVEMRGSLIRGGVTHRWGGTS